GKISLPSTILQSYDLGGQRGIRNIWPRYYDDCHAVAYVIDADDGERLSEGWEVFDTVLSAPQMLGLPLLLLANKQDSPQGLSVEEIRHDSEDWYQRKIESSRRDRHGDGDAARRERIASLDVSRHDSCRTRSLKRTSRLAPRICAHRPVASFDQL
ncbi:hypothetical protein BDZ89DRAFT_959773, partial [Hymenopellis radicata]